MSIGLTEHQLQIRKSGVGASECSIIMGTNPYESVESLVAKKRASEIRFEQSSHARWGSRFEDDIAAEYEEFYHEFTNARTAENHPVHLWTGPQYAAHLRGEEFAWEIAAAEDDQTGRHEPPSYLTACEHVGDGTFRSRRYPWLLATPDRLWSDFSRLVEIKAPSPKSRSKWPLTGWLASDCPAYYYDQVLAQAVVMGIRSVDLVALIAAATGYELRVYPMRWDLNDEARAQEIVERTALWWRCHFQPDLPEPTF